VRHPVAHQPGHRHRVRPAGEHGQIGQPAAVVGGPRLPRHPVNRPGDSVRSAGADVGRAEPGRGDVGGRRQPVIDAAHPGHPGCRDKGRDAGADPARAVDPDERRPAAGEHRRPAVAVPVGERGAGELGLDPLQQVAGQGGAQAGREVVEHPGRGQQAQHPVHGGLADAVAGGCPHYLVGVARPVE
jgi:hypothetical protein